MAHNYSRISNRIKAAFVDGILLILLMYGITEILGYFETVPNVVRGGLFFLIFVVYEPIAVSLYGRTFGHLLNDMVVKSAHDPKKNITFPRAVLRFFLKATLGWISLLTIGSSPKKQAIHDRVANSVVLQD